MRTFKSIVSVMAGIMAEPFIMLARYIAWWLADVEPDPQSKER